MHRPPLLLSVAEAAIVVCVGRSKLYELIARREIETVKIGRKTLIPARSLDAFVERLSEPRRGELPDHT